MFTITCMATETHRTPLPPSPSHDWAQTYALFLDIGTLLDLAATPDDVQMPDDLIDLLRRLQRALDGALALVSGRRVAQIDALFAPLQLPAIGLHGLEIRTQDAAHATSVLDAEAPPELAAVRAGAQALASKYPGTLIEDKGSALALHWRNAPAAEEPLHEFATSALINLPGYHLQPGHHVFELRPDGAHKGHAILTLLGMPTFFGRRPVVIGDDLTDENGFIEANAHDGISVLVGDRPHTVARYRLPDPLAVREWCWEIVKRSSSTATPIEKEVKA